MGGGAAARPSPTGDVDGPSTVPFPTVAGVVLLLFPPPHGPPASVRGVAALLSGGGGAEPLAGGRGERKASSAVTIRTALTSIRIVDASPNACAVDARVPLLAAPTKMSLSILASARSAHLDTRTTTVSASLSLAETSVEAVSAKASRAAAWLRRLDVDAAAARVLCDGAVLRRSCEALTVAPKIRNLADLSSRLLGAGGVGGPSGRGSGALGTGSKASARSCIAEGAAPLSLAGAATSDEAPPGLGVPGGGSWCGDSGGVAAAGGASIGRAVGRCCSDGGGGVDGGGVGGGGAAFPTDTLPAEMFSRAATVPTSTDISEFLSCA